MSPVEWYYARGNKQSGPVNSAELKRLAMAGDIGGDDLVWREGMSEWTTARNVRGLFEEENKPGPSGPINGPPVGSTTGLESRGRPSDAPPAANAVLPASGSPRIPARHPFDTLLEVFRPQFNAAFVDSTSRVFRACGSYGLLVAMALSALFTLTVAVKTNTLTSLVSGLILLLVLAALQYTAGKFCDAAEQLNRSTSGALPSSTLADGVAVLSKMVAGVSLLGAVVAAIETSHYLLLLSGLATYLVFAFLAVVAMNPAALNIQVAPVTRTGEESIGAIAFVLKALLRTVPVAFGAGVLYGTCMLAYAFFQMFSGRQLMLAQLTADGAGTALTAAGILPFVAYLLFLLYYLFIDIARSLLSLSDKAEKPMEQDETVGKP